MSKDVDYEEVRKIVRYEVRDAIKDLLFGLMDIARAAKETEDKEKPSPKKRF
jgi:hypothetical protein